MKTPGTTFYFSKIDRTSSAKMAAASFLSGFAALTYQVIWQKCLTQEVGLDSISTSLILSVFLLGLAFGYLFGSLIADSLKHLTPGVFVCVEVATGIFGLFSISYLRWANNLLLYDYPLVLEFLLNFLVLVIPTFLMGMSTPLLFSSTKEKLENFGKTLGIFYGANLLGAAIGTLGAGFFLIELIGLKLSSAVGASANFLSGFIAFNAFYRHPSNLFYSRKFPSVSQILKGLGKRASFQISWRWQIVVSILLFGFVSIGFEMVAVVFSVIIGFVGIILGNVMESRIGQLSSMAKRNAADLITLPFDLLQHRIVPYYVNRIKNVKPISILEKALHEEAMKNPIEPERQEKIIKDLRAVVHRLKPFIEEIKPLLKDEKPNSP